MGISGHMLGEKKLRKLAALTGLALDRAYIRNGYAEGRVLGEDGSCRHWRIDPASGWHQEITRAAPGPYGFVHWSSCPRVLVGEPVGAVRVEETP